MSEVDAAGDQVFAAPDLSENYRLVRKLGEGGFGTVYQACQLKTGQQVAIKVMKQDPSASEAATRIRRFRREMQLCARLNHPNIVRLIDSGDGIILGEEECLFTVFEYVEGQSLRELLEGRGMLEPHLVKDLMLQVCEALLHAHDKGVLHRDLKPENIMLTKTRKGFHVKLVDFGVSTVFGDGAGNFSRITASRTFVGTYAYAAPEHLHGNDYTPLSDLYAWGLNFLEALQGQRAVAGQQVAQVVFEQMSTRPVVLPAWLVEHPLGSLLARVVEKDPTERIQSLEEVADALTEIDVSTLRPSPVSRPEANTLACSQWPSAEAPPPLGNQVHQIPPMEKNQVFEASVSPQPSVEADLARLKQQATVETRRRRTIGELALRIRQSRRNLQEDLKDITETATHVLSVERASLWLVAPDRKSVRCASLYRRDTAQVHSGDVLHAADFPSYFRAIRDKRALVINDVFEHPASVEMLDYCSSLGISSMLDAAFAVGADGLGGVLCHEHVGMPRVWSEEETAHAGTLADLASLAFSNYRSRSAAPEKPEDFKI